MSNVSKKLLMAAGGASGGGSVTVDQVFSTFLYTGNSSTQIINNGLDMSGEGGLTWLKSRSLGTWHHLFDTERGANKVLVSNESDGEVTQQYSSSVNSLNSFNSNGFTLGAGNQTNLQDVNYIGKNYVSWSFRKAPKFFDVVTFTTDSSGYAFTIPHSLGTRPGFIISKRTDGTEDWLCGHRGTTTSGNAGFNLKLNSTAANLSQAIHQDLSDTSFTFIGGDYGYAANANYVSYLFADNSSEDAADRLISCGTFDNTSNVTVDCGFEPQWVLVKGTDTASNWFIFDAMRQKGDDGITLSPNLSNAEGNQGTSDGGSFFFKSNGFFLNDYVLGDNIDSGIYVAIRRDNMAEVTDATKVFAMDSDGSALVNDVALTSGFPVDMVFHKELTGTDAGQIASRLQGSGNYLRTSSNAAEASGVTYGTFDHNDGFFSTPVANMGWMWKRAKGYFDVVAATIFNNQLKVDSNHSLSVIPEMIWSKDRDANSDWYVFHKNMPSYTNSTLRLNSNSVGQTGSWIVNSTKFNFYNFSSTTGNSINYLFATLAGVSKVSSVVHSGTTNVDAGFTNGSRFVLLKRTDASGDWYIWDSVRGIASGNDPYLLLNSDAAQVTNTDYIDPYSAGFTLTSSLTAGTYIYYAIA